MSFAPMPLLHPGGRLAVVAPSGPFDRPRFEQGLAVLASRYHVEVADEAFGRHRYLAGDDPSRARALQRALDDDVLGFSDVTALHLAWQARGWRSIHGPVVTQLGTQPPDVVERTCALLEGRPVAPLVGAATVRPGVAEGPLIGGNLSLLASLVATPFFPPLSGAVLLLEDVGERPYRLDRLWTHLALCGALAGVAGVVLGEFTDCEEKDAAFSSAEVLRELVGALGVPAVEGFPIGHGAVNQPVVLGARVRLDASARTLEPLEGLG